MHNSSQVRRYPTKKWSPFLLFNRTEKLPKSAKNFFPTFALLFRLGKWKICPTYRRQMPRDQRTRRQERREFFGQIICHTGKRGEAKERVLRKSTFSPLPFFSENRKSFCISWETERFWSEFRGRWVPLILIILAVKLSIGGNWSPRFYIDVGETTAVL